MRGGRTEMLNILRPRADSAAACLVFPGLVRIIADQPPTRDGKVKHLARKSARGLAMLSIRFSDPRGAKGD